MLLEILTATKIGLNKMLKQINASQINGFIFYSDLFDFLKETVLELDDVKEYILDKDIIDAINCIKTELNFLDVKVTKNNIDSIKTHFNKLVELALFLNGCQWNDKIITDESYDYKISRLIKSIVEDVKALQIKINSNLVREIFIKKRIK
tara:strand:+ start:720 stop:1169 length:450 start_codon:yes stop_codon:yes gene_type:complete